MNAPRSTSPAAPSTARALLVSAQSVIGRRRSRALLLAGCFLVALAALGLIVADALVALPEAMRIPALPLLATAAGLGLLSLISLAGRLRPDDHRAARLVERAGGDRWRTLSTALALERMPGELAAAGAERLTASLTSAGLRDRLPAGTSVRWLMAVTAVCLMAGALHLVWPRLYPEVLPRFLDPHGDHPPFSSVRLDWAEAPDRVRAGDAARFEITVDGLTAAVGKSLVLHAQTTDGGRPVAAVSMFQVGTTRFAGELANVSSGLRVWVEGGGTRTHFHELGLDPLPVLVHLDVALEAPAYALLEPERRRVKPGELAQFAALPGSRLRLSPVANRPLAAVHLLREGVPAQRLVLGAGHAELVDVQPGAYSVMIEATDGIRSRPLGMLRIDARSDQPPHARITSPGHDALATPGMIIPLVLESDDDLGLVQVVRIGEYNQLPGPELRTTVSGRLYRSQSTLMLAELGVAPGDLLSITLVAKDSKPDGGQISPSVTRHISIISEEAYNREVLRRVRVDALERKYLPLAKELAELEKRMAELKKLKGSTGRDALDHELAELARKTADFQGRVRALRRDKPLFAIEPELQQKLLDAAEELAAAAASGDPAHTKDGSIGEMLERDLALLTKLARIQGLAGRLRQLIDAEQNTVDRLTPLAEHRHVSDADRVRLRELGDQETTLAEGIEKWLELAPKLADDLRYALPSDPTRPDEKAQQAASRAADETDHMAQLLEATGAADLKRKAAAAARAGDGGEAHRLAAEARDRLLALLPASSSMTGSCDEECLRISWGSCSSLSAALRSLGMGFGNGFGLGGVGSAGLGLFLGYGGDDLGGSMPSMAMDLYGPENLGDLGGNHGDQGVDGVAAIAASGGVPTQQAAAYRQAIRATTGAGKTPLTPEEQRLIDEYYRQLDRDSKDPR